MLSVSVGFDSYGEMVTFVKIAFSPNSLLIAHLLHPIRRIRVTKQHLHLFGSIRTG